MTVKTAISLDEALFQKAEALAQELQISRSYLFTLAVQKFIELYESQHLLETLNAAYADDPDPQEAAYLQKMRPQHRRLVEDSW